MKKPTPRKSRIITKVKVGREEGDHFGITIHIRCWPDDPRIPVIGTAIARFAAEVLSPDELQDFADQIAGHNKELKARKLRKIK